MFYVINSNRTLALSLLIVLSGCYSCDGSGHQRQTEARKPGAHSPNGFEARSSRLNKTELFQTCRRRGPRVSGEKVRARQGPFRESHRQHGADFAGGMRRRRLGRPSKRPDVFAAGGQVNAH